MAKPKADDKPKNIIQITSLEQLGAQKITLEIALPDGETVLAIPVKTMTYAQWWSCAREIPAPHPPGFAGRDGMRYDRENPEYQRQWSEWNEKVSMLRVLKSLDFPIAGDTQEQRLETLTNTLGAQVTKAIIDGLSMAHAGGTAHIKNRAETFQPDGTGDLADNSAAELASA